jgi:cell division protein FtsB
MMIRRIQESEEFRSKVVIVCIIVLTLIVLLGLGVLPLKNWKAQTSKLSSGEKTLVQNEAEIVELESKLKTLNTDEEIERLARRDYGLVMPGEESYRILK